MKTTQTIIAMFALLSSATAFASAPVDEATGMVRGKAQSVTISPEESREILGKYQLDDGSFLVMSQKRRCFFVEIPGKSITQVIPTSAETFTSGDKSIQLRFKSAEDGVTKQVKVIY